MYSHAHTSVAGTNFIVHETTCEHCDVAPYTSDYKPINHVPIVNAATAFTNVATGKTIILYFHQVLWCGNTLKMSLINPNQVRHFGIAVSDDPTDTNRPFGISDNNGLYIPFTKGGTTVYFESHKPSEMENCRIVQMTDERTWDPSTVEN
jgi:hypothetical protein